MGKAVLPASKNYWIVIELLPHPGRHIADSKTDPRAVRSVGARSVYYSYVVERHFAGLQSHVRSFAFLHLTGNLQGNKIVWGNRHAVMRDNAAAMRTADHAHAAIIGRAVTERQPCRGIVQFAQAHIKTVLMPGNISGIMWALPEYLAGMNENIRTKHIFHGVEHSGMENQVLHPTMKKLKVTEPRNLGTTSERRCQFFQGCPRRCYFRSRQDRDGKDQAILLVFAYLLVRKQFRHGPTLCAH